MTWQHALAGFGLTIGVVAAAPALRQVFLWCLKNYVWQKMSGPPPPSGCRKPYPLTENHFTHRPCDRPSSTTSNLLRNLQPVNIGASASTPMTVHAKSALSIMAPPPSC